MSTLESTLAPADAAASRCDAGPLPVDPFVSLRPHFGMLLGVDDFETVDAYHRGKTWLHSAWLHRQGTVWGLGVALLAARGEIEVSPGLAVDGLGRELCLDVASCLHLGRWYAAHREDPAWAEAGEEARIVDEATGNVTFVAHVTIRAKRCLTRQVPALVEPCEGDGQITAFSRLRETVELRLEPGPAPARGGPSRPLPYHRLRLLFGLAAPETGEDDAVVAGDQEVLDARAAIFALDPADQPAACLEAFRRYAALDAVDLRPAEDDDGDGAGYAPVAEPGALVLAELRGVTLRPVDDQTWELVTGEGEDDGEDGEDDGEGDGEDGGEAAAEDPFEIDNTVRDVHVATTTVQELLCGPGGAAAEGDDDDGDGGDGDGGDGDGGDGDGGDGDGGDGDGGVEPAAALARARADGTDAGGPRVRADSVHITARQVSVEVDPPVHPASTSPAGASLTVLDPARGWLSPEVRRVYYAGSREQLVVELAEDLPSGLLRLVLRGTGPAPILGVDGIPFAGGPSAPPAGRRDGNDFVYMIER